MTAIKTPLDAEEVVARCVVRPKAFVLGEASVFAPERLLEMSRASDVPADQDFREGRFLISTGSRNLLATDQGVHEYGCRIAANQNASASERKGEPVNPLEDASHYLGFYDASVGNIIDLDLNFYKLSVLLEPENGEEAHCHIELRERDVGGRKERAAERVRVLARIWAAMWGPVRAICDCDQKYAEQLKSIELPIRTAPTSSSPTKVDGAIA